MRYHAHMQIHASIQAMILGLLLTCFSCTATAAELLIIESDDCPYCLRFHAEIGVAYPKTEEGKVAPLRILQLGEAMPDPYADIKPATVTPTFILVDKDKEVDRIVGYPGDEYFWFLLGQMLDKI